MKAYLINDNAIWFDTLEIASDQGRPPNAILTEPPHFDRETHFAAWSGDDWLIRRMEDRPSVPAPVITSADVDAEHDRRVLAGRAFAVDGIGNVPLEGSEKTQLVLLALKDTARDLKDAGITAPALMFTDRDGTDRRMTAGQMIALVNAGKAWVQSVHEAKRALKAMDPIPADFADDRRWPS